MSKWEFKLFKDIWIIYPKMNIIFADFSITRIKQDRGQLGSYNKFCNIAIMLRLLFTMVTMMFELALSYYPIGKSHFHYTTDIPCLGRKDLPSPRSSSTLKSTYQFQ